ncbi:MAG TPA: mechanosensitive ion channel domain-containing protein [Vicinamibacterales bacterium]
MPNRLLSRIRALAGASAGLVLCGALWASLVAPADARALLLEQQPAAPPITSLLNATPSRDTYPLSYFNRSIAVLKATVLGRTPRERAEAAADAIDTLVGQQIRGPVVAQPFEGGALITVGGRIVLVLTPPDVDTLSGETLDSVSAGVVARLRQALEEAGEARSVRTVLRATATALFGIILALAAFSIIGRGQRYVSGRFVAAAEKRVARSKMVDVEMLSGLHLVDFERGLVTTAKVALDLIVLYWVMTFVLRQFPYSRPWGESLRGFLVLTVENLGLGMIRALPGLFTVGLIFVITRFAVRVIRLWFGAVERGTVSARWIHPETAQPTRRLLTTLAWLFGAVIAYPYLPGSQSDAFKGVSVFIGLMVTIGSSGLVSQIMSGFVITFSRSLRLGDFVKVGDVEGNVIHVGVLSTKIKTLRNEDITIPNAVVVAQTTTDYSRFGDSDGVFIPTSVTIGYDAPWRQVHALLLEAAARTEGIRNDPKPIVLQVSLEDFYVKYALLFCLKRQETRPFTLNTLHANIQDLFNEYGVQIMSPNYMVDPAAPKVVARKDWFAAPAESVLPSPQP